LCQMARACRRRLTARESPTAGAAWAMMRRPPRAGARAGWVRGAAAPVLGSGSRPMDMQDTTSYRRIQASCHCGNIRVTFDWPGAGPVIPVRACGCALCTKHKAVWTSHPQGRFSLQVADDSAVTRYRFGTRTADFHICLTCGVVPLATCLIEGARYAV